MVSAGCACMGGTRGSSVVSICCICIYIVLSGYLR